LQNEDYLNGNSSNHDSDIESRLYAEIYFSNTIEGDNEVVNPMTNNQLTDNVQNSSYNSWDTNNFTALEDNMNESTYNIQMSLYNDKNKDTFMTCEDNLNQINESQSNNVNSTLDDPVEKPIPINLESNPESTSTIQEKQVLHVRAEINLDKSSNIEKNINNLKSPNKNTKSNKQSEKDNNFIKPTQSSNKRCKITDKNASDVNLETEKTVSNSLVNNLNTPTINCSKSEVNALQQVGNKPVNACVNKSQNSLPLASKNINNLLLDQKLQVKNKVKKKRLKKKASKQNVSKTSTNNHIVQKNVPNKVIETNPKSDVIIKNTDSNSQQFETIGNSDINLKQTDFIANNEKSQRNDAKIAKNNVAQFNSPHISEIIDISSESSKDSMEDNSKYNMIVATDKKLVKTRSSSIDNDSDDMSDTESIFEVPVPRKPTPPLIDIRDSDNERSDYNSSSESLNLQKTEFPKKGKRSCRLTSTPNVNQSVNVDSDIDCELMLNCTQIPTQASNLMRTERLNQNSNEFRKGTNSNKQKVTIEENLFDINKRISARSAIKERNSNVSSNVESVSTKKVSPTLNNKQKNKDSPNRKYTESEGYFFQPMNKKMKAFYNKSWGGEDFDIDILKEKMSRKIIKKIIFLNTCKSLVYIFFNIL
jgi:hypothetical protein